MTAGGRGHDAAPGPGSGGWPGRRRRQAVRSWIHGAPVLPCDAREGNRGKMKNEAGQAAAGRVAARLSGAQTAQHRDKQGDG